MQQISSGDVFLRKVVFPVFWFGFLGFFAVVILLTHRMQGGMPLSALFFVLVMGAFGFFFMKKFIWDVADQVLDAGDSLVIRFGKNEERVPLSNITNVSYNMSPSRITLTLRNAGRFGNEVSFAPPQRYWPYRKNPMVDDLIQRVDAARRAAGASVWSLKVYSISSNLRI